MMNEGFKSRAAYDGARTVCPQQIQYYTVSWRTPDKEVWPKEFLRTPNGGHLAVVLIRGDCVTES